MTRSIDLTECHPVSRTTTLESDQTATPSVSERVTVLPFPSQQTYTICTFVYAGASATPLSFLIPSVSRLGSAKSDEARRVVVLLFAAHCVFLFLVLMLSILNCFQARGRSGLLSRHLKKVMNDTIVDYWFAAGPELGIAVVMIAILGRVFSWWTAHPGCDSINEELEGVAVCQHWNIGVAFAIVHLVVSTLVGGYLAMRMYFGQGHLVKKRVAYY